MARYEGGCHCGAVRFSVETDLRQALDCNCSICTKKGFLHLIVPKDAFTLTKGKDSLSTYRFNTGVAIHTFCKTCGIHAFYTPRSHPDGIDVNVRCLDRGTKAFTVVPFDGENWEANAATIQA